MKRGLIHGGMKIGAHGPIFIQNDLGKKNKVAKLTERRIRYIIRAKTRGESSKRVAKASRSNHPLMGGDRTFARFYQVALTRGHWRTVNGTKIFLLVIRQILNGE